MAKLRGVILPCALALVFASCSSSDDGGTAVADSTDDGGTSDALQCPTHILTQRITTLSKTSFGATGAGHGGTPVSGLAVSYELFDCEADCRRCRFHGPVSNGEYAPVDNQRCLGDLTTTCTSDADCGGTSGDCQFIIRPPAQGPTGWIVNYAEPLSPAQMADFGTELADGMQGVINLETGEIDFDVRQVRVVAGLGNGVRCLDDVTPDDGNADGTCEGTSTPCDVHGLTALAPLSFDCALESVGATFSLPQHGAGTSGRRWQMDDTRPLCTSATAQTERCWCGVCADDPDIPCFADDQCPTGTCGSAGTEDNPISTFQNVCAPGEACTWNDDALTGTCMGAAGEPVACVPADGEWVVTGSTSVQDGFFVSVVAVLGCIAEIDAATGLALDAQFGFPGPLVAKLPLEITPQTR